MNIIKALREGPEHQRQHEREARMEIGRILDRAADHIESLERALRLMLAQFQDHEQWDEDGHDTAAINAAIAALAKADQA